MYKIKVPVMHSKLKKDAEANDLQLKVEDDRKHMIEATIVKVMKSRRRMTHVDLITESSKILSNKFNPDPLVIKKRIECLIEKEYIERSKEDRKCNKNLAWRNFL